MLVGEVAATPNSPLSVRLGAGTCVHAVPFQCSIKVLLLSPSPVLLRPPTAQALVGEMAATPSNPLVKEWVFGLGTCVHAVPFQCSIKVRVFVWVPGSLCWE